MQRSSKAERIEKIQQSMATFNDLLHRTAATAGETEPLVGEWSARDLAAHMAAVEKECHLDRVQRLAAGGQPHFDIYLNTGRDFSGIDLTTALADWAQTRQALIAFVATLSKAQLQQTGTHPTFGHVTILDILAEMHKHDEAHIRELQSIKKPYGS